MLCYKFNSAEAANSANDYLLGEIKKIDSTVSADKWSDVIESENSFLILKPIMYNIPTNYEVVDYSPVQQSE